MEILSPLQKLIKIGGITLDKFLKELEKYYRSLEPKVPFVARIPLHRVGKDGTIQPTPSVTLTGIYQRFRIFIEEGETKVEIGVLVPMRYTFNLRPKPDAYVPESIQIITGQAASGILEEFTDEESKFADPLMDSIAFAT